MMGLRDIRLRRLGAALAGAALYVQLAVVGFGLPLVASQQPADGFGEHALCLADAGAAPPASPADSGPAAPAHEHGIFCCLWHSPAAVAPQAALLPQPVAYAATECRTPSLHVFVPGPRRGPLNPRAPPSLT